MEQEENLVRLLPDDALAGILRRLPHRSLAVSRCVCRAWRDTIDGRRLLLPHLLPHSVGGIFIEFNCLDSWEFLARPTTGPKVSGKIGFAGADSFIQDHCNGLLLLYQCVVNPATRRWASLPQRPPPPMGTKYFYEDEHIVFDPAVSLHYEVFTIPRILYMREPGDFNYCRFRDKSDHVIEKQEWPPSPFILPVFSSRTGQWEERSFLREGKAAGTIAEMRLASISTEKRYGVYWRGELYVHCEANFVMRISLSNNKYQVIEPPTDTDGLYLGKSEKGVYCASVDLLLRVWILKVLNGRMEWALKHQTSLKPLLAHQEYSEQSDGPWILQDINYYERHDEDASYEALEQAKIDWDSDNDNVLHNEDRVDEYIGYIDFLGFHPYKEVVFLGESMTRGLAYHLNSSKFQDLGNLYPRYYGHISGQHGLIRGAFPYTPCWIDEFPQNNY
uniref:F-box domain-containing protein n=1 Tax=Arundo donax TaxID=35708 RepID=A0A0A9BZA0_ARUDO